MFIFGVTVVLYFVKILSGSRNMIPYIQKKPRSSSRSPGCYISSTSDVK